MVHVTNAYPMGGIILKLEDNVFTKVDAKWVHHPHEDVLVITIKIANSLVHRMLMHNGSVISIFCWDTYQKIGLTRVAQSPTTSPLYRFTGDHMIPKGTIKLAVSLGKHS